MSRTKKVIEKQTKITVVKPEIFKNGMRLYIPAAVIKQIEISNAYMLEVVDEKTIIIRGE